MGIFDYLKVKENVRCIDCKELKSVQGMEGDCHGVRIPDVNHPINCRWYRPKKG